DSVVDFSRICGKFALTMGVLCLTLEGFLQPAIERVFYIWKAVHNVKRDGDCAMSFSCSEVS
ncbi:hypothetical protein AWE71_25520, partial [Escherichia coli]